MKQEKIQLGKKQAEGFVIPIGPVNLVFATTDKGLVGCGAFDVLALDKFNYPAARVKATRGTSITSIDDLLVGEVREANAAATKLGLKPGQSGKEALELL